MSKKITKKLKKKYTSLNFRFLHKKENLTQDEFGAKFGLKKNSFGTYISRGNCTNFDFLEKLMLEYNLTLDQLFYVDLSKHPELFDKDYYIKEQKDDKTKLKEELETAKKQIESLIKDKENLTNLINTFAKIPQLIDLEKKQNEYINEIEILNNKIKNVEKLLKSH